MKLSVVLATLNEEENIGRCLEAVKKIADEIIIFDEHSHDKTRDIAKRYGAKVYEVDHSDIFHVTKQRAIDKAKGEWILQLDADEVVSPALAQEIKKILSMSDEEIIARRPKTSREWNLFTRHTSAVEKLSGKLGENNGEVSAFFIPRVNMFLDKPLMSGGKYPDGVIRLIKKGKAYLAAKSVHEQMTIEGEVCWLFETLAGFLVGPKYIG